ncbi:MAG: hypothetical protein JSV68_13975 [Anaerolineaceae bacterium]|nr:hypothetical protein [Chloroflexota bacterium]UCC50212.1 MAG: hypothetical protein JSV68_13975 [Anaerolineaceae bacterium]
MAKRKVELTEDQKRRNAEILARLELERQRLCEETRALQLRERSRPGRKRRKKQKLSEEVAPLQDI